MKNYIYLLFLVLGSSAFAQPGDCIDPNLIDPNAICTFIYDPVCGCDGMTYSNSCVAETTAGVTSWTMGECPPPSDCLDLGDLDFGECAMPLGIALINGTCTSISGCSYIDAMGYDYESYFYDSYQDCQAECASELDCFDLGGIDFGPCDAILGIGLLNGNCTYISGCSLIVDEVDYSDYIFESEEECAMACGGSCYDPEVIDETVFCNFVYEPVCGCDSVTYMNECIAYYVNGITEWTTGPCSCPDPSIQDLEIGCVTLWDPVCGCDGITYGNDCEAWNWGGITEWTPGECGQVGDCTDVSGVDFGDCEMFLGFAVLDGECAGISGCGTTDSTGTDYSSAFFASLGACEATCDIVVSCIDSLLLDPDILCTQEWDPVCGCDSVTYTNGCIALNYYGLTSWTQGECDTISNVIPVLGSQFSLFPNPAQDLLSLKPLSEGQYGVSITDISGRLIFRLENVNGRIDIDVSAYQRGMYMVTLRSLKGETSSHRVIVE